MKRKLSISCNYIVNLLFVDKSDSILNRILSFLTNHPTLYLTILYVFFSALGLLFEFSLFSWFKVNIFDYLDASDLFLAAFKYPKPLILSLFYFCLLFSFRSIAKKLLALKYVWPKSLFFVFWPGLLKREIIISIFFVFLFATYTTGAYIKAHDLVYESNRVVIIATAGAEKTQEFKLIPIGSTERFFLGVEYTTALEYARAKCSNINVVVLAIPFANIKKIKYREIFFTTKYGIFMPRDSLFFRKIKQKKNCPDNKL